MEILNKNNKQQAPFTYNTKEHMIWKPVKGSLKVKSISKELAKRGIGAREIAIGTGIVVVGILAIGAGIALNSFAKETGKSLPQIVKEWEYGKVIRKLSKNHGKEIKLLVSKLDKANKRSDDANKRLLELTSKLIGGK